MLGTGVEAAVLKSGVVGRGVVGGGLRAWLQMRQHPRPPRIVCETLVVDRMAVRRQQPSCVVWLDRHTPRTGGRTTAQLMSRLQRAGVVLHREAHTLGGLVPYAHSFFDWQQLVQSVAASRCVANEEAAATPAVRVAVQTGDDHALTRWVPEVRSARVNMSDTTCCAFLLTLRVREPLEHYLSAYIDAAHPASKASHGKANLKYALTAEHHVQYAKPEPFTRWSTEAHNLQSRALLHGHADSYLLGEVRSKWYYKQPAPMTEESFAELEAMLRKDFDLVVPVQSEAEDPTTTHRRWSTFAPFLRHILRRLRLHTGPHARAAHEALLATLRHPISPRRPFYGGGITGAARAWAIQEACPNMTACAEHVRRVAPYDHKLFALAQSLWERHTSHVARETATGRVERHETLPNADADNQGSAAVETSNESRVQSVHSSRCAPHELRSSREARRRPHECQRLRGESRVPPELRHSLLDFSGACALSSTAVGGIYGWQGGRQPSPIEHMSVRPHDTDAVHEYAARAVSEASGSFERPQNRSLTSPARRALDACPALARWPELLGIPLESDRECTEVRLTFAFRPIKSTVALDAIELPRVPYSPCNLILTDNRTGFGASSRNWTARRLSSWPWPYDMHRSTHVMKVLAPVLFPHATTVLFGDIKCFDKRGRLPCAAFRPPVDGTTDLVVPVNRWFYGRSIEGEFVGTWKHLHSRRTTPVHVFSDMSDEMCAQEQSSVPAGAVQPPAGTSGTAARPATGTDARGGLAPYDMQRARTTPDILCMGWRNSAATRAFACAWAQRVARGSMREQLSFDWLRHVVREPPLQVQWLSSPFYSPFDARRTGTDAWSCLSR